jgi:putative RNA 2'-phosphotransferase
MTHPALVERITRSLAYMLRHQPEKFDLELDPYGWAGLDAVVRALNEKLGEPITADDVREAIASGDRPRYELSGDRVRALYGHSIDVLPGEPSKPPEFLYVGVAKHDSDRAQRFGLRGGRRRFLHLARSVDEAREAGRRTGPHYAVLTVFALDAWEEGVNFYDRQALFLAEEIPTQFIEVQATGDDGYEAPSLEREPHFHGGGRQGAGRPGGGRHGETRGGGHDDRGPRSRGGRGRGRRGQDRFEERRDDRRDRPHEVREPRRDEPRREEPQRQDDWQRERAAPRPPAERREERRPVEAPPAERRPAAAAERPAPGSDFGLGIFEAPEPPPRQAPRPEPAPAAVAAPPKAEPPPRDDGPGFGAGL